MRVDLTRYQYGLQMSAEDALNCIEEMAWAKVDGGSVFDVLKFHCISDPEDSYFSVLDYESDLKRGIKEAVFHAYNKWQEKLTESASKAAEGQK